MRTMEFSELHMILSRLNECYGVTKIAMSEEGFAMLGEQMKQLPGQRAVKNTDNPIPRAKIGDVHIEVLSKYGKMMSNMLWHLSPPPDPPGMPEQWPIKEEDRHCDTCKYNAFSQCIHHDGDNCRPPEFHYWKPKT